jgi:hypothetical protein
MHAGRGADSEHNPLSLMLRFGKAFASPSKSDSANQHGKTPIEEVRL